MERCREAIRTARHDRDFSAVATVNRSYYAAFYGASAVFASGGRTFVKHSGVRSALHRDLVSTGACPRRWAPRMMHTSMREETGGLQRGDATVAGRRIAGDQASRTRRDRLAGIAGRETGPNGRPRLGRTLSNDDIEHDQKIIVALGETIRIMAEIDRAIDPHGGRRGAFITDPKQLEAPE